MAVAFIIRKVRLPIPYDVSQTYKVHFSQSFDTPPSESGDPGDFFAGKKGVWYKDVRLKWKPVNFNGKMPHPSMERVFACYDAWGPRWTAHPLPYFRPPLGLAVRPVASHLFSTIYLYFREHGYLPNTHISVDD